MRSKAVVVLLVDLEDSAKRRLTYDEQVIETLGPLCVNLT